MSDTEDGEIERIDYTSTAIPTGSGEYIEERLGVENGAITVGSHDKGDGPIHLSVESENGSETALSLTETQVRELSHWLRAHSTEGA